MEYDINMHETYTQMKRLIVGRVLGQGLSEKENRLLDEWLAASEDHRALYHRVKSLNQAKAILKLELEHYGKKMSKRFMQVQSKQMYRKPYRHLYWSSGVAAAIMLIIGIWLTINSDRKKQEEQIVVAVEEIVPGETKAILTLADGENINVLRAETTHEGNVFVDVTGKRIVPTTPIADSVWHKLTVPAGGEFQYTLSDGTEVWLNSASELRFPATFAENERRVYLQGEAFFIVKKENNRHFIVVLPEGDISVYGTRFVVASYEEIPLSAVLVQGSIGFKSNKGESIILKPEERLIYESGSGDIRIERVDTALYTSWVNKMFLFRGQPLGEIMTTLARWYNLEITFADAELRDIRFSGRLNRYQDVRILLHTFEEIGGIYFNIDGRNIEISKDKK